jgi:hypothetical protein
MEIVQIVLDKKLLHAADQAAKRSKRNRSALVRDALREHLRRLELRAKFDCFTAEFVGSHSSLNLHVSSRRWGLAYAFCALYYESLQKRLPHSSRFRRSLP